MRPNNFNDHGVGPPNITIVVLLIDQVVRGAMQIDVSLRVVQIVPADHKGYLRSLD
jgi:hypothetical protein